MLPETRDFAQEDLHSNDLDVGDHSIGSYRAVPLHNAGDRMHNQMKLESIPHRIFAAVDLRSIRNVIGKASSYKIFARYCYPFFGSSAPIITHPPTEINRHSERLLSNSLTTYEFTASPTALHHHLLQHPLVVDVLLSDSYQKDIQLGVARIDLAKLLKEKSKGNNSHIDGYVAVLDVYHKKVAELRISMTLEDRGIASEWSTGPLPPHKLGSHLGEPVISEIHNLRSAPEYTVAFNLEQWKLTEQARFSAQLQQREETLLKALADGCRQRERQRDLVSKRRVEEYVRLQADLNKSLVNCLPIFIW